MTLGFKSFKGANATAKRLFVASDSKSKTSQIIATPTLRRF